MNIFDIVIIITSVLLLIYLIIIIILFKALNNLDYKKENKQFPVSIIVSLHDEEKNVNELVQCLVQQDYPKQEIEIILVNDRSTDRTGELLKNAGKSHQNVKIISIDNLQNDYAPKKFAIDTAIKKAKGEIILLTDADGRPNTNWVKTMVSYFAKNTGMVLGYAPYVAENLVDKVLAMEYFSHATIAAATTGAGYPLTCVGTNMAYRKKIYTEINGFGEFKNIHSGDDDLFLQRVRDKTDWEIRYATEGESQVQNEPPNSLKQFLHQRLRYASKGFKYPVKVTVVLTTYYFFNVMLFLLAILSLINNTIFIPLLIILFFKGLADYSILKKSSKTLHTKIYFLLFPIVFIFHIPYVVFFGMMGNIKKYKWAGIKY
jgi:poly-beta-1,6-N-acetyl-D-glucosamine synthase